MFIKTVLLAVIAVVMQGCVTINPDHLLPMGTKVEIQDVSNEAGFDSGFLKNFDMNMIRKKLVLFIGEELTQRAIETVPADAGAAAAKLKLNILSLSSKKGKYEIAYKVTLEAVDGSLLFTDSDEKEDDDIEGIIHKIATRVARYTDRSFKKPITETSQ